MQQYCDHKQVEESDATTDDRNWLTDLDTEQTHFWEEGWQALPAPAAQTTPKLIPVITTGQGMDAIGLAQTYFRRWNCQENAIRDWLIPLNLDTNHGYAKEQVVNSELSKRQVVTQGRIQRLEQLAQASRARLTKLRDQAKLLQERMHTHEQKWMELSLQVSAFEVTDQTEERDYFPLKARQLAADWQVRKHRAKLEKNAHFHSLVCAGLVIIHLGYGFVARTATMDAIRSVVRRGVKTGRRCGRFDLGGTFVELALLLLFSTG